MEVCCKKNIGVQSRLFLKERNHDKRLISDYKVRDSQGPQVSRYFRTSTQPNLHRWPGTSLVLVKRTRRDRKATPDPGQPALTSEAWCIAELWNDNNVGQRLPTFSDTSCGAMVRRPNRGRRFPMADLTPLLSTSSCAHLVHRLTRLECHPSR